jgi:uncharacterized SAM-binding protein YcdF (DUF218 family)
VRNSAAIVPGGGLDAVEISGQFIFVPNIQVKHRLNRAYELFAKGSVDYIATTGKFSKRAFFDSRVTGYKTEAQVGKKYLEDTFGMDSRLVIYKNQSIDTIGNAFYVKKICIDPYGITKCRIITSEYHLERSKVIFDWVFGPNYTLEYIGTEVNLSKDERITRKRREDIFISYVKTYLVGSIAPRDDKEISKFLLNEHHGYCLTERSEALYNAELETASIIVGYLKNSQRVGHCLCYSN